MLNEVKYSDLNSTKKIKSIKDAQRAAHSQGYDMSDPKNSVGDHYEVELTHRKTGEKVKPVKGGSIGGAVKSGDKIDSTLINQSAASIKRDASNRGRVDKRKPAKDKRKAEAKANKEAKDKARDPFTRKKTFEEFMFECVTDK